MKKVGLCFLGMVFVFLSGCSNSAEKMIDLKTKIPFFEWPNEELKCYVMPLNLATVEPEQTNCPSCKVPKATVNLALAKPVSSASGLVLGCIQQITDGEKSDAVVDQVELDNPGLEWIQIDLKDKSRIYALWIWHDYSGYSFCQKKVYRDVIVQISNDTDFKNHVVTIFNNDSDNSANLGKGKDKPYIETPFGKLIALTKPIEGQYIRLYSSGCNYSKSNRYIEVEVYGLNRQRVRLPGKTVERTNP